MMERISVLLADDHHFFRDGVRVLLDSVGEMVVVGEASTGEEVITLAVQLQPDIILMDINMPGVSGIEATRRILGTSPHTKVLMLTMYEDDDSVFAALRAGARGYLLKGANQMELLRAIHAVRDGEVIFGAGIAQKVMGYFAAPRPSVPWQAFPDLTDREREILTLIARGHSNAQITAHLMLSPKTVRNHISNIFSKLQVADRVEAIARAREAGMGRDIQ
jgi:DNA-binding NarL/FixJ family response regulator